MHFNYLLIGGSSVLGAFSVLSVYLKTGIGVCRSTRDLEGKTVIITGANTGIGFETAKDLAARHARVILACRTVTTGEKAMQEIAVSTGNNNLAVKQLDVSSFASVRAFAQDILTSENRLDILINNAGIAYLPQQEKSADGLEMIMATNHFGPFLLTNLLLPLLKKSAPSRVVVVSSRAHENAKMDFTNLNGEKHFGNLNAYRMSKLANILFTLELSQKLKETGVTVNALHPGVINTDLVRNMHWSLVVTFRALSAFMLKSPTEGAQTSIHLAVSEELEGVSGKYFSDCAEKELIEHARDSNSARRLWLLSEKVTGLGD